MVTYQLTNKRHISRLISELEQFIEQVAFNFKINIRYIVTRSNNAL